MISHIKFLAIGLALLCIASSTVTAKLVVHRPSSPAANVATAWTVDLTAAKKVSMPLLAFGTGLFWGSQVKEPLMAALKAGYRHVDCAQDYENWAQVHATLAAAMQAKVLTRQELFYASKSEGKKGYEQVMSDVQMELEDNVLGGYIDLYYIHSRPGTHDGPDSWDALKGGWQALEELHAAGKVRSIGVSNFRTEDLQRLMKFAKVAPMVNQIKYSIYDRPTEARRLEKFCIDNNIATIAYSPFETVADEDGWGSWMERNPSLFHDTQVAALAKEVGSSAGLVVLNWYYQRGMGVVSRSSSVAHMAQNMKFHQINLTGKQLAVLDGKNLRTEIGDMLPAGATPPTVEDQQRLLDIDAAARAAALKGFMQLKEIRPQEQ